MRRYNTKALPILIFAASLGGYFEIPHGIICGTLLAESTRRNIAFLQLKEKNIYLEKYAQVGAMLIDDKNHKNIISKDKIFVAESLPQKISIDKENLQFYLDTLLKKLDKWTEMLHLPKLNQFGVRNEDISYIVAETGNKNNPALLSSQEMTSILENRL